MDLRTYATRFLLIMTAILGFTAAQGPMYAGDLEECVTKLISARDCFAGDTTTLKAVFLFRNSGNEVECTIENGADKLDHIAAV